MAFNPEQSGERDLPRARYVAAAYRLARRGFGPEVLQAIAERGEDEWFRVANLVYGANGFTFTRDELRAIFRALEKAAWRAYKREKAREDFIDRFGREDTLYVGRPTVAGFHRKH